MDVNKYIKAKNLWIFDDTFDCKNQTLGLFVTAKDWLTNGGKNTEVFVLSINGDDYMIMPFKIDYMDFVEAYGTDTRLWEGHQFKLIKNEKNKYKMVNIEVKI